MRLSIFFAILFLSGCATQVYWHFPPGKTQQDFARDDYECINSVKVVSQPQTQQQTVVQQSNTYGNNTAVVSNPPDGWAGSLQKSIASMPTTYVDPNMYKLCMRSKGYVQGQKP